MGASLSNRCRRPPVRDTLELRNLQFFDLVLIRSKVTANGTTVDARIATGIKTTTNGVFLSNQVVSIPKWDRVGIIQLPTAGDPSEFDHDNITVTEATHTHVQTISLRELCDTAAEVCVRQLRYRPQISAEDARRHPNRSLSQAAAMKEMYKEEEKRMRQNFKSAFYGFSGAIVRKPYSHPMCEELLAPMFQFCIRNLKPVDMRDAEEDLKLLLDKYDTDATHRGQLSQDSVLKVFRDLSVHPTLEHTFSDAETFQLRSEFTEHGDSNWLPREAFEKVWRDSLRRTLAQRKQPRETVSGAFISLLLQKVGVFNAGSGMSLDDGEEGVSHNDDHHRIISPRSDHKDGHGLQPHHRPAAWALPMDFAATSSNRLLPGGKVLELFADPHYTLGPELIVPPARPPKQQLVLGSDTLDE